VAAWNLRQWRRHGPGGVERRLLREVSAPAGLRILEIGGGIGALQAELLKKGAASGEVIELVEAYRPFAAELARAAGVAGRTDFRVHDIIADPDGAAPADVVLLNRVTCCSAEGPALVRQAARLARRQLLLSYPRPAAWLAWGARLQHVLFRLLGRQFRFFVYPRAEIDAAARAAGLTRTGGASGFIWEHAVYEPAPAAPPRP